MTYFIEAIGQNLVKIGVAHNVERRLAQLQTACPFDLQILCAIEDDYEELLHTVFESERVRGEWFRLSVRIREFIRTKMIDSVCVSCGTFYRWFPGSFVQLPGMMCNDESINLTPCAGSLRQVIYHQRINAHGQAGITGP